MIKILRIFVVFGEKGWFSAEACVIVLLERQPRHQSSGNTADVKIIPVTRINQDQLHSVIQFALIMTELWKTFEEAALVNTDCCLCGQKIWPN